MGRWQGTDSSMPASAGQQQQRTRKLQCQIRECSCCSSRSRGIQLQQEDNYQLLEECRNLYTQPEMQTFIYICQKSYWLSSPSTRTPYNMVPKLWQDGQTSWGPFCPWSGHDFSLDFQFHTHFLYLHVTVIHFKILLLPLHNSVP